MSPRTRDGITGAVRMVDSLAAVSPKVAAEFAADLSQRLDPASPIFHPLRFAAEAALERVGGAK